MRRILAIGVLFVALALCGFAQQGTDTDPSAGVIKKDAYTNPFFGFRYKLGSGWEFSHARLLQQVVGNKADLGTYRELFAAYGYGAGLVKTMTAATQVAPSGVTTTDEYAQLLAKNVPIKAGWTLLSPPAPVDVAGFRFFMVDVQAEGNTPVGKRKQFITRFLYLKGGQVLEFSFVTYEKDDHEKVGRWFAQGMSTIPPPSK